MQTKSCPDKFVEINADCYFVKNIWGTKNWSVCADGIYVDYEGSLQQYWSVLQNFNGYNLNIYKMYYVRNKKIGLSLSDSPILKPILLRII
jgi:hypothetical protein